MPRAQLVGLPPIDLFGTLPLTSVIIIVSWEWLPFAFLILLTALQSLDEETLEAARLDGAGPISVFFHIQVPHMGRAISVVVMMETIFLLGVFAEIYVTTSRRPGHRDDQPRLPDLPARAARLQRRRRLGGRRDRDHPRQHHGRLPGAHRRARGSTYDGGGQQHEPSPVAGTIAWLASLLMFFPIAWMVLASFKTEVEAVATPPPLIFTPTLENYRDDLRARRLSLLRAEQRRRSRSAPPS